MVRDLSHGLMVVLGCGALCALVSQEVRAQDPVAEVGKTVGEWVKARAEIVRLEESWRQEKALLDSTVSGLKERASSLQDKRDHLLAETAVEREELAALTAKSVKSQQNLDTAETGLYELGRQLIEMRPLLPPRLSEALEMAYRSLAGSEPSPGERMQLAMTILNRCAQFNAGIEQGEEIIQVEGEQTPVSVDVIYWGLSHGYALDRVSNRAWIGAPAADRWRWEPLNEAVDSVATLIAIRRDEADPELISVPARIDAGKEGRR